MQPSSYIQRAVHEGVKYPFNATIKQLHRYVLFDTKRWCIKESNTLLGNATIKLYPKDILLTTKGHYIKVSNTPAGNATIQQLQ